MTDQGWIRIDDLYHRHHLGEKFKIATLHNGKIIKYDEPIDVYEFDYDGMMYKLESQQVDFCVTMNHKMWAKLIYENEFSLVRAQNLYKKNYRLKKNGWIDTPDVDTIDVNGVIFDMGDFLDLLAIFISDGRMHGSSIALACSTPCKVERIKDLCYHMSLDYNITMSHEDASSCAYLYDKDVCRWFKQYSIVDKFLPDFVFDLNSRQARIMLISMISCDDLGGSACYHTSSSRLADDVMRLAIHAGWSGSVEKQNNVRIIKTNNEPQINHGQKEELVNHTGKVYCLEVPSHVFMMRYNNKNVWSGNSSRHGELVVCVHFTKQCADNSVAFFVQVRREQLE
jgi:replicative DNA helicase Mcm